jgi:hypothetical protein
MRPAMKRLKKRHETNEDRQERQREEVLKSFEFMQPEVIDLVLDEEDDDFIVEDQEDAHEILRNEGIVINMSESLEAAFLLLRDEDVEAFLKTDIIQHMFSSAYALLASFGPGMDLIRKLWHLHWTTPIVVARYKFGFKSCCKACGRQRVVRYKLTYQDQGVLKTADIGTDCHEIKVVPLFALVVFCLENAHNDDIGEIRKGLKYHLKEIREAPLRMAKLYADK